MIHSRIEKWLVLDVAGFANTKNETRSSGELIDHY
jgi:hypothetical protein